MPRGVYQRPTKIRPYCYERKGVWRSNVRETGAATKFVGTYPTKEAATAAANHYIVTGEKPPKGMFGGSTRTGPKGPRPGTAEKRRNSPQKAVSAVLTRKSSQRHRGDAAAQKPAASRQSSEDRIDMIRNIWRRIAA